MRGRSFNLKVAPLEIKWVGKSIIKKTQSVNKVPSSAQAWRYRVQSTDNWSLVLAYCVFPGGSRDIRTIECSDGTPEYIRRLKHGLRMSVFHDRTTGVDWVELSQAQLKDPEDPKSEWSTRKKATEAQLDKGAGFRLGSRIEQLGGSFGLREDILEDSGLHRNYYCAAFPHNDHRIPVLCYVATRVLALIRAHQRS